MATMKYNPEEEYKEWVRRVQIYEYGLALQRIAEGEPAEKIASEMAKRITEKCLHPWLLKIKENAANKWTDEDSKASAHIYKETYLDKFGPVADHVIDENHVDKNIK
jgi:glutamyl-tRNA reductase